MSATLIAKVYEAHVNANWIICKADNEPGVYLTKSEYLNASGKVEATSVGWSRIGKQQLTNILNGMDITVDEFLRILSV